MNAIYYRKIKQELNLSIYSVPRAITLAFLPFLGTTTQPTEETTTSAPPTPTGMTCLFLLAKIHSGWTALPFQSGRA